MTEIYGQRWTHTHGFYDEGTWLAALQHFTPEQVGHGLRRMMQIATDWPPSLPTFVKLCSHRYEGEKPFVDQPALESDEQKTKRRAAMAKFVADARESLK